MQPTYSLGNMPQGIASDISVLVCIRKFPYPQAVQNYQYHPIKRLTHFHLEATTFYHSSFQGTTERFHET
jgi:hypothetical protein